MDVDPENLLKAFSGPHRTLGNQEARDEQEVQFYLAALVKTLRKATTSQQPSSLLNLA
jgi:hypothetical protein